MEQSIESVNPRKRAGQDLDSPDSEEIVAKRARSEASSSPHLTLLEELYDLEGEDEGAAMVPPLESSTQEDLVAEMMKSLEKVIESGESGREEGEASTSDAAEVALVEPSLVLDFSWNSDEIVELSGSAEAASVREASFHGELEYEEDFKDDAQIRQLLQASDDELGLPLSSSSSDLDENAFHEEWASLANEGMTGNVNWLDASFHQFDDAPAVLSREVFEPLLLF